MLLVPTAGLVPTRVAVKFECSRDPDFQKSDFDQKENCKRKIEQQIKQQIGNAPMSPIVGAKKRLPERAETEAINVCP